MKMNADTHGASGCVVFLDGKELRWCYEADDEANYAICATRDQYGFPDRDRSERREGNVTFVFKTPQDRENAIAVHEQRIPRQIDEQEQIAAEKWQHIAEYERKQLHDQYPQRNRHERRKAAKIGKI